MHGEIGAANDVMVNSSGNNETIKARVVALAYNPAKNFYELALALAALHEAEPSSLSDVVSETVVSRRRLYYLLGVGRLLKRNAISQVDAETLGWTKLQIIARHVVRPGADGFADAQELMAIASKATVRALPNVLMGSDEEATRAVVFHLTKEQRDELKFALLAYGAKVGRTGLVGKEKAIIGIAKAALSMRG